jgi:hypothetical protein
MGAAQGFIALLAPNARIVTGVYQRLAIAKCVSISPPFTGFLLCCSSQCHADYFSVVAFEARKLDFVLQPG